jgi:predicted Zn-dependent peptidase
MNTRELLAMKISKTIALAAASAALAGSLALAEDGAASGSPKAPHRKWQDVPQPPLEKFQDPKPVVATLKNGMKVFLLEDHELPTIEVELIARAGEMDLPLLYSGDAKDARAKAGLAAIAGQLMRTGGTDAKTGDELDEELDGIAASVETSCALDQAHARMSCLKENLDQALAIFVGVVRHPAFREDKIALAKRQHLGGIRRRNDNPAQIASREFARLMYGDASPLGWTEEPATVEGITREDLARFYDAAFASHPETALLGAVGDFDAAAMKAKLDAALGDWTAAKDASRTSGTVRRDGFESPAPKVYLVKKPDVNQSTVILGHVGIERRPDDPDYPAAVVANSIMSGGFAGRLMQHVRTEMGLAYGVSSRLDAAFGHQGLFVMQGQTKSGSTLAMARAMRKELERLVAEPPSAEELRVAKQAIQEKLVFSAERKADVLDRALRNEFYGFPQDELEIFQRGVAAVSAEDCVRVAKKLFHPERLTTLIVGNDAEFDGKAEELGEVTLLDVKKAAGFGGRREAATGR